MFCFLYLTLTDWIVFAQKGADGKGAGGGAGEKVKSGGGLSDMASSIMIPLALMMVVFYFLLMRPQQKKQAETALMLKNLKKNDRVVTVGGILGVVVNVQKDSDEVTLKIDETTNSKIHVLRSHIARVIVEKSDKAGVDKVAGKSAEKSGDKSEKVAETTPGKAGATTLGKADASESKGSED